MESGRPLGRHHRAVERAGRQHRRCDQDRRSCFGRDQSFGPQCCHRSRAGWRSRSWLRRRCRRGARAGRNLREKRPRRAKSGGPIQEQVSSVAAMIKEAALGAAAEAEKSQTVILALGEFRKEVGALAEGSQSIAGAALEAEAAAREAQKGAEIISSAAEEQAAAAAEALAQRGAADCRARRKPDARPNPWLRLTSDLGVKWKRRRSRRSAGLCRGAVVRRRAGNFRRGSADHGRRRADQPRRAAAGCGDAGSQRRDGSDRKDGAGGKGQRRRIPSIASKQIRSRCWLKSA